MKTIDVSDLMTIPYDQADCYTLAALVLARLGVCLPSTPDQLLASGDTRGRSLSAGETAKLGDVVVIRATPQHLGVVLAAGGVIHTSSATGVAVTKLAALERLGVVERIVRPRELETLP